MSVLIKFLRAWIALLTTRKRHVSALGKIARAILLVPAFGMVLLLLHMRARLAGPWITSHTTPRGQTLRCRLPDLIQMYIVLFDVWEPDLTHLIDERLAPGDVFIDVGANIGYYSLLAASKVGTHGKVVAIDALPSNFAELQHNIQQNHADNIRAINCAVAAEPGNLTVYAGPSHNVGLATTAPGQRKNLRVETTVTAAPLGECLQADEMRRARLVKIDVEGAEPGVIAGLAGFLAHCNEDVEFFLELSPAWWDEAGSTPEKVLSPLRAAGFNTYVMDNSYWPWRYLWPQAVRRPRRVQRLPDKRVKRIDLVLSRLDSPVLEVSEKVR